MVEILVEDQEDFQIQEVILHVIGSSDLEVEAMTKIIPKNYLKKEEERLAHQEVDLLLPRKI